MGGLQAAVSLESFEIREGRISRNLPPGQSPGLAYQLRIVYGISPDAVYGVGRVG